jgi:hypothetical protein
MKALPYLMERVADRALPDEALTPVELTTRQWRREAEQDLGGELVATRQALLDAAMGSMILLASLDRYVFELAERGGLVNKRSRRIFPVVESRMRIADGLTRQLQALVLERRRPQAPNLAEYLAKRAGATAAQDGQEEPQGSRAPSDPTSAQQEAST